MNATDRPGLTEETCRQFSALTLLDRLFVDPEAYHAALLEGDDELLESLFDYMMKENLVTVGENDHFQPTEKGRQAYRMMLHQQESYLTHFDIFAATDLAEGSFADLDRDDLEAPNWSDLRVAVADFKGVDPYRMVFLSMLADGSFFENPDWKFDLALGSSFFTELEEVTKSQIRVADLGYQDEDGTAVSGEAVVEDVILQGARINRERIERARQASLFDEERQQPENGGEDSEGPEEEEWVIVPYDPWGPAAAYMGSALFIEALWMSSFW